MFDIERWQEIFETIRMNKLRTFLTGLSVASGIFILVILLGFSTGIQKGISSQFEQDAASLIFIRTGVTTKEYKGLNPGREINLHLSDFQDMSRKYKEDIEYKTPLYTIWGGQVNYKNQTGNYRIEGAYPENQFIENESMVAGRFLNQTDISGVEKVMVIGNKVKQELFKDKEAVGEMVSVYGINFRVIGVYSDPGGDREESRVFIPLSTAQRSFNAGDTLRSMSYTVKMQDDFDQAVALSTAMEKSFENDLKTKYNVAPDDRGAVRIYGTLEEAKKIYTLIDTIRAVFWFVGIGTIIAGVVGVGNIMLIIVKERTKEIGVRKAIGATPSSIIGMVLQEAIFITTIAGFTGLFLGVGLLELISPMVNSDFIKFPEVDFKTSVTTVIILIIAGAVAGFIPARRAAHIKPIDALRDE
ncbi:ABC transporter permease [Flavimarina sp. Hel_I_48]|uniref:ABC transporter permease n=1 Tax=Flavimarina sp. Hel_I_48 TaxID=1392488 RepID=UPI0004DEDD91|nr:ABC transporter permease [Flavimarina sp. Hel_I_48]